MSDQYTPTGGQTIFPRINFLKTFSSRLQQRISNGRVAMYFKRLFGDASLDLNFASSKSLVDSVSDNNLVTFSRASSGTYVGSDGLIKTATTDAPRFDHDPVTGESLGLLIEESRTNLLTYSEEFDNSYWTKISSASGTAPVVTPNNATAPDGTLTADRIVGTITPTGGADYSLVRRTIATSGDNTWSIWLKSNTGSNQSVTIKYASGSAGNVTVTPEWQRFSITVTQSNFECDIGLRNESSQLTGNSMDILAWGAQLEAASSPSSYIPTTDSTVTRAADVASIEGTNFSSWYNQSEGTVFVAVDKAYRTNTIAAAFDDGSDADRIEVRSSGSSLSTARYVITDNSTTVYSKEPSTAGANNLKLALAYKPGSVNNATNGVVDIVDATTSIPNVSRLAFQNEFFLTDQRPDHISRFAYFPTRKSDEDLINLTT